ncbi:MAG: 1,4-dihydroxy-2-naphthoate octaprenyltransferase [Nocardioidaceae bacterium]
MLGAALACFGLAALAGLILAVTSGWWLAVVGALAILAAWFYTGGPRPYGYRALGELSVFVFFGLVAVIGTAYVQTGSVSDGVLWTALGVGSLACAILVANNLRDIPTDEATGKRTLAVVMGSGGSRAFYSVLLAVAYSVVVVLMVTVTAWSILAAVSLPLARRALTVVRGGAAGPDLIPVLRDTGLTELVYAGGLLVGMLASHVV